MFACEADKASLTGEYAQWLVSYARSGYSAGIAGPRDDYLAFVHDWEFDLTEARRVTIWQGDQDQNVTPSHSIWLAERIPAELRLLPNEGHISIGLRFPEILDDLLARAGQRDSR
jgi:pimeloyl-ACP methyl ester carboxylesterase